MNAWDFREYRIPVEARSQVAASDFQPEPYRQLLVVGPPRRVAVGALRLECDLRLPSCVACGAVPMPFGQAGEVADQFDETREEDSW